MKYTKIKSKEQYNSYCDRHEVLTLKNYESNSEEFELIEIIIDEYEQRTIDAPNAMNPVELIEHFLLENNLSKSQLAKDL